eukprot:scaffold6708_cov134-Cylindrotheca_fusiformis.AAC.33
MKAAALFSSLFCLFLLLDDVAALRPSCYDNGDCFELISYQPECSGNGREVSATIKVRLDHSNGKYVFYSIGVLVDWGDDNIQDYGEETNIPINQESEFTYSYTYSADGTYETRALIDIDIVLDEPPNGERKLAPFRQIEIGNGSCNVEATDAPTPSPVPNSPNAPPTDAGDISTANSSLSGMIWTSLMVGLSLLPILV